MSVLFCDTNCELWWDKAKELKLNNVIRMPYTICNKEYFYDLGENYNAKEFYDLVRKGNMPITSGLNAENYKEYFEPFFKKGEDILYVSFSSKMSATFNYLDMAIKELSETYPEAKFTRFDTKGISMSAGLAVYRAAKLFNEGKSTKEIVDDMEKFIYRINSTFTPADLSHLKRGGRLSASQAFLGNMLQLKPIIRLTNEGTLENTEKVNGRNKSIAVLAQDIITNAREIENYPIVILNADCAEDAQKIENKVKKALPNATIWSQSVGPVIGTHCGPGALGVCFVGEKRYK